MFEHNCAMLQGIWNLRNQVQLKLCLPVSKEVAFRSPGTANVNSFSEQKMQQIKKQNNTVDCRHCNLSDDDIDYERLCITTRKMERNHIDVPTLIMNTTYE